MTPERARWLAHLESCPTCPSAVARRSVFCPEGTAASAAERSAMATPTLEGGGSGRVTDARGAAAAVVVWMIPREPGAAERWG